MELFVEEWDVMLRLNLIVVWVCICAVVACMVY